MNKSTLFLFYMLSITTFSCSAMKEIERVTYELSKATTALIDYVSQKEPVQFKSSAEKYRASLEEFSIKAETLKNSLTNTQIRLQIVDTLRPIRDDIAFIVKMSKQENNIVNQKSLRLQYLNAAINEFGNLNKSLNQEKIRILQNTIEIMADFSINENGNTSLLDSNILVEQNLLKKYDIEILGNKELLEFFQLKQEEVVEKERQAKERIDQMLLTAQEKKIQSDQLKAKQLEKEKQVQLLQEKLNAEIQESGKIAEQKRIETEKKMAERLATLELERKEAERLELEKLEANKILAEKIEADKLEAAQRIEQERLAQLELEIADGLERLEKIKADKLERSEKTEADRLERLEADKLKKEIENEQKKTTMRRYIWATGIGIVGLTAAAIMWYCNLHTKYIPWFNHA